MSGSVAIVTGASSGIRKATALRLARDFQNVVIVARRGDELADVPAQIKAARANALALEQNLMAPAAAEAVVKAAFDQFGRIDALLNVAGAIPGLDVFEMTGEQWSAGIELKFHGARRLTMRAWEALKASKGAVVFPLGNAAVTPKAGAAAVAEGRGNRPRRLHRGGYDMPFMSFEPPSFRRKIALRAQKMARSSCCYAEERDLSARSRI
jgi:3-oxoacyl-[acyl-carrier protein] reductase